MTDSTRKSDDLRFQQDAPRKSVFKNISPRVIIYPIVVIVIVVFMTKNKQLAEKAQQDKQLEQQTVIKVLDPMKPAQLAPANAPAFPQLIFYHENNIQNQEIIDRLRDKYYKTCTVQPVDISNNPSLKQRFNSTPTPFAVFSKPDGTEITVQNIASFDFFDKMLESMLKPQNSPVKSSDSTNKTPAPSDKQSPSPAVTPAK